MEIKATYLKIALTLFNSLIIGAAFSQTPFSGPSDGTTAPPASASAVQQLVCNTGSITLSTTSAAGTTYQWYKKNTSGLMVLVQQGSGSTYTETPTAKGYYTYTLVSSNASGCTSTSSDPFNVFVLPGLTATITPSANSVCEQGHTNSILTASPVSDANYTYTYVWTRNGTTIPGAATNSYTVNETATSDVTFGVTISYGLNATCGSSATQTISVLALPTKPLIVAGP